MGIRSYLRGDDLLDHTEERTLTRSNVSAALLPYSRSAMLDVNTTNALRVADAYAAVRCLADSVASLPLHVYRRTPAGRVPAGEDARAVRLFNRPSPGSTSADLLSQVMTHLNVYGDAFVGKYRSDGEIVQLGLLHPERVQVELRGQRIVYTLSGDDGRMTEHGPDDVLHLKGMSVDGLRGLSPVSQCRLALSLSANLQENARQFFEHGSRPSGILTVPSAGSQETMERTSEAWTGKHAGVERMHRVAVLAGEATFTPISFSADDNQFLQQRELSAREVARIFRVPAWAIDAPTGDSLTYANVLDQNRAFVTHSLRPWLVRIERAFTNDSDLCPGNTYVQFELDGLLRADSDTRSQIYERALKPDTGWMRRDEVRELEDLAPETATETGAGRMSDAKTEQRTATVEVENVRTEGKTLHGFACLYGAESRDLGGFTERIEPGAFSDALAADPDVLLTFNHSPDKVLARTGSGTLKLSDEERGLAFEAELEDGPTAQDVRDMVRRGDLSGASFRFKVAPDGERWEGEQRTLTKVDELIDVSLATTPAYDGPRVELRTKPTDNEPASAEKDNEMEPENQGGGLALEDRTAKDEQRSIDETIVEFVRDTKRGEARALTTSVGVSQAENSTRLFDKLRASSVFLATGVNVISTDSDSIVFPQLTADAAPAAYAEAATITPGDPTIATITATPRKYAHLTQLSNELVDDSDPSIIEILRQHLTTVLSLKLDLDFFEGSGTAPAIRGLANVSGIQTETSVGSFANLDWVASAISKLETENVPGPYVLVSHPRTLKRFRTIKTGVASSVEPLLEGPMSGNDIPFTVYGVRVVSSSQLSIVEGGGTNENSAYLFAPSQLYVVRRSDVEFEVDRTVLNSDQTEVRIKTRLDLLSPDPKAIVRASGILA